MADVHDVFAHLRSEHEPTYRLALGAFTAARRRFVMHLRPSDVADAVRTSGPAGAAVPEPEALVRALNQLCEWGNLRSHPDTSRVTSPEDFYRARYLYQLTQAGEAAERALAVFDEALGRRGALQSVALTDIAAHLRSLGRLAVAEGRETDPALAHLALIGLTDRFRALAENAEAFMGSLQRTVELQDVDVDAFLAYKKRLVDYLERFIGDLLTTGTEIAGLVAELDGEPIARLVELAVEREASDLAPDVLGGVAAGGAAPLHPEDDASRRAHQLDLLRAAWQERWDGVRGWFLSRPGRPSQASTLRSQARSAVPALLAVVATLNERRQGRSDRAADFRALAVSSADDDDERHRLWHAAFGLSSVRHLSVDGATLEQLLSDGPRRLVGLLELGRPAFRLLLALIGTALAAARPGGGPVEVGTGDGSLVVQLQPVPCGGWVSIASEDGVLSGPDHELWVRDAVAPLATLTSTAADGAAAVAGSAR